MLIRYAHVYDYGSFADPAALDEFWIPAAGHNDLCVPDLIYDFVSWSLTMTYDNATVLFAQEHAQWLPHDVASSDDANLFTCQASVFLRELAL